MERTPVYDDSYPFGTCATTVGKLYYDFLHAKSEGKECSEVHAQNLVYAKTLIPTPRIRRLIEFGGPGSYLIVMDRIKGNPLSEIWNTLSIWKKAWVAFTLRRYIAQLRRFTKAPPATPPGPISPHGPGRCICDNMLPNLRHPLIFPSLADLGGHCNERYRLVLERRNTPLDDPAWQERFDDSEPLVLCHGDLSPRNMIMGEDGWLWLIDWEHSGYYPPWFENFGLTHSAQYERMNSDANYKYWELFLPFICGNYFKQTAWMSIPVGTFRYAQ